MNIRFLKPAREELDEAVLYYEQRRDGLGIELAIEVNKTIDRIRQRPESFESIAGGIRRGRVNRFPYDVLFSIEESELIVVAVAQLNRKPGYWKLRLREDRT